MTDAEREALVERMATCESCKWWEQKAAAGYCRVEHQYTWRQHCCPWWCGEHQPREARDE